MVRIECARIGHSVQSGLVRLRPLTSKDVPFAASACSDEWALKMLGFKGVGEGWIERRLSDSIACVGFNPLRQEFIIESVRTGQPIGVRSLSEPEPGRLVTGSWMHPSFRNQGLGKESLAAALWLAHYHFGYPSVLAATAHENVIAQRMLSSTGLVVVAESHPVFCDNGTRAQCVWYESQAPSPTSECSFVD